MTDPTLLAAGGLTVVALLATSAFFSSTETAIFSLPPDWTDGQPADDERVATLAELRADPHRLLVTLLVGNNVVNIAISSIVTVLVAGVFSGAAAVTVATLVASSLVLVCGEIVPKSYGLGNARRWALTAARPIALVERALFPVVVVFDVLTRWIGAAIGGDSDIEEPYVRD